MAAQSSVDWPHWRGPDYNGISREKGWKSAWTEGGPGQLWTAEVGIGFSAVSVSDGKAYTMGNTDEQDSVFCFDAETGELLWKHDYPQRLDPKYYEGGTLASPTVAGNKVYTVSKDGLTLCMDAQTGKVIWQKDVLKEVGIKRSTWGCSAF